MQRPVHAGPSRYSSGRAPVSGFWLAGLILLAVLPTALANDGASHAIRGRIVDAAGHGVGGVMVSAIDVQQRKWTSVCSQPDGSFVVSGLRNSAHHLRTRLAGLADEWRSDVAVGTSGLQIETRLAKGEELELQRPASSAFSMLKFDNPRDKMNFKMMCSYCHQVGTLGFRTPEKPVDWETMLRRMDGFGGLYPHTQDTIIGRLMTTYKDDAVDAWPAYDPPPAPTGLAAAATITLWELDRPLQGSFHDLEIGRDGKVYAVNISRHRMIVLDPESGQQTAVDFPRHTYGPHSIETANDGSLWTTMCASGKMVRYDIETGEFDTFSSAEAPRDRGNYPHTLRINPADPEGLIWYTDAGSNSCFSLHPTTHRVKEYRLLSAGQALGAGRGESRGITPYGLDFSPVDGMIWYSKLNGNRIGRIDPAAEDGDIREWNPPFRGPRRLHVAPDGMVWVPGFGSGVFGRFDPETEYWTVYELPDAENQIPYALNVDQNGIVWVCGTGNDTINRFDPETETLVEFRLPNRVSYTREIEFGDDGSVWTSTSGPARHMERGVGAVIRISLPADLPESVLRSGGIKLTPRLYPGNHDLGNLATAAAGSRARAPNYPQLFTKIDSHQMPAAYKPAEHQAYVDRRMSEIPEQNRGQVGRLWNEFRKANPDRRRDGAMFVRILEHVARSPSQPQRRFIRKWQHYNFGSAPDQLAERSLERGQQVFEQATCSRCHSLGDGPKKPGPDLSQVTRRFRGSRLLRQIVNPSAEIHKEFQTQMILADDGRLRTGLVIDETDDIVRLLPNLLKPDQVQTIRKSAIEERKTADVSTMPTGLLDTYSKDEIFDLLAWIQSRQSVDP